MATNKQLVEKELLVGSGAGSGSGESEEGGEEGAKRELCSSKEERMTEFLISEFKERIEVLVPYSYFSLCHFSIFS